MSLWVGELLDAAIHDAWVNVKYLFMSQLVISCLVYLEGNCWNRGLLGGKFAVGNPKALVLKG